MVKLIRNSQIGTDSLSITYSYISMKIIEQQWMAPFAIQAVITASLKIMG